MKRRQLSDLDIIEVSLVDRPANKRKFILFKSELKEGSTSMPEKQETEFIEELVEEMEKAEASGEAEKLEEAEAQETQSEEAELETQQEQQPEQETEKALSQKAQAAIKAALKALWPVRAEIPRSVLDVLGRLVGYPGYGYPYGYPTYGYPAPMGKAEELPEEVKTALEALWKEREELSKRLEEAERIAKQLEAKAQELQKTGLSKEQAIAKVIEENPELYEQYRKEIFERR